jgi:hypothetical protein
MTATMFSHELTKQAKYSMMDKNILRRKDISSKLQLRTYRTIIINLLLWGCESWALKEEDKR